MWRDRTAICQRWIRRMTPTLCWCWTAQYSASDMNYSQESGRGGEGKSKRRGGLMYKADVIWLRVQHVFLQHSPCTGLVWTIICPSWLPSIPERASTLTLIYWAGLQHLVNEISAITSSSRCRLPQQLARSGFINSCSSSAFESVTAIEQSVAETRAMGGWKSWDVIINSQLLLVGQRYRTASVKTSFCLQTDANIVLSSVCYYASLLCESTRHAKHSFFDFCHFLT